MISDEFIASISVGSLLAFRVSRVGQKQNIILLVCGAFHKVSSEVSSGVPYWRTSVVFIDRLGELGSYHAVDFYEFDTVTVLALGGR